MLKKILLTTFLASILLSIESSAQTLEQVHLKDGSVLEGYISEQIPGKILSVQTYKAQLRASSDSLLSSNERQVMVNELPSEWKKWVMAQPTPLNQVVLTTLKFPHSEYADVLVTENGLVMDFLSLTNRIYTLPWSQVSKTVKPTRQDGIVSGIEDVITLKDGTRYEGQITEQVPGKTVKILLGTNNATTVNSSLVSVLESKPISADLSLIEQTPLLDRVYTKHNKTYDGFITKRQMGKSLTISTLDGQDVVIPLTDVTRYGKYKNPEYKVISDRQLAKGDVILNGDEKNVWFAPLKSENGYFILDESASAIAKRGDEMTIEANLENPSGAIYLIRAYRKDIPLVGTKKTIARDVFTYQDLVELALPIERTQTPLGNTKITFKVPESGDYIMSIQGYQGFIVIHVD